MRFARGITAKLVIGQPPASCDLSLSSPPPKLIDKFNLDEVKLANFLMRVEDGYPNNPYHNRIHAADVLQSLNVLLCRGGLMQTGYCDEVALLACYLSAVRGRSDKGGGDGHRMGHRVPGINGMPFKWVLDCPHGQTASPFRCAPMQIIHDYQHKGVNNDFLIRMGDSLAVSTLHPRA